MADLKVSGRYRNGQLRYTRDELLQALALHAELRSYAKAAARTGVSRAHIHNVARKNRRPEVAEGDNNERDIHHPSPDARQGVGELER